MNKKIKLIRLNYIVNHSKKNIVNEVFIKIMYMTLLNKSKSIGPKHNNHKLTHNIKK
jgi:hypothetical protein